MPPLANHCCHPKISLQFGIIVISIACLLLTVVSLTWCSVQAAIEPADAAMCDNTLDIVIVSAVILFIWCAILTIGAWRKNILVLKILTVVDVFIINTLSIFAIICLVRGIKLGCNHSISIGVVYIGWIIGKIILWWYIYSFTRKLIASPNAEI